MTRQTLGLAALSTGALLLALLGGGGWTTELLLASFAPLTAAGGLLLLAGYGLLQLPLGDAGKAAAPWGRRDQPVPIPGK